MADNFAEKIAKKFMDFGMSEVSDFMYLEENMEVLGEKLELLKSMEDDVLIALQDAELFNGRKRKREVENWLLNVGKKRRLVESLDQQVQQLGDFDIFLRRRLGKSVAKMIGEVEELVGQGVFPDGLVVRTSRENVVPLVTSNAKGLAFDCNLKNILSCLTDDEVFSIGIHGMGGVGKTNLATHIHDKLLHDPEFTGGVYWVTVSQELNPHKLQNDIARRLKLDLSGENDEKRKAALLFQALKKMEKFVIILDDVWKPFDVLKMGIPAGMDGCKLLVTSRSADVCRMIGCQKNIKVEPLSTSEAWELFQEKLGHVQLVPEVEEIAREVARRCGGLPLGIITMAGSMRGVADIHEWKDVLEEMKASSSMGLENMENEVLPVLLCSYKRLGSPKLQRCFLYCCLYPEDYDIPRVELIDKFIMEELIDQRSSRQAYYDQGHAILNKLENVCLLESRWNIWMGKCVKMHDLVREMALWITRDKPRFMVKAGLQLEQIPPWKDWTEDLNKVSLMWNMIHTIPSDLASPKCPNLSTLFLNQNPLSLSIPDSFFLHMPNLQILNLSSTEIEKLPDSLSVLENLKALLLPWCRKLKYLPSLEKLKALRELNLSGTGIEEVIRGMENLTNLESLNLSKVRVGVIPSGTLLRNPRLQKLLLQDECIEVEEILEGLTQLEEFRGTFCSVYDLNRFIKAQHCHGELTTYKIHVGRIFRDPFKKSSAGLDKQGRKALKIFNKGCTEIGSDLEIMLPRDIKRLRILDCAQIECIVRVSSRQNIPTLGEIMLPFRRIEELELRNLPAFEGIGVVPAGTFSFLRKLKIFRCPRIKFVIPAGSMSEYLHNLEILEVSAREQMEEIIGGGHPPKNNEVSSVPSDTNSISSEYVRLPRLREFWLSGLPELKSICKQTMLCVSIWKLHISGCKKLKKVPIQNGKSWVEVTLRPEDKGTYEKEIPKKVLRYKDIPTLEATPKKL